MKVYTKILLWSFGTLVLSLVAFIGVSIYVSMRNMEHGNFIPRFNALLMEEAIESWQTGGQPALAAHMQRVTRHMSGNHYLTDASGKDLATGEDRSKMLAIARPDTGPPKRYDSRQVIVYPSPDGKYSLSCAVIVKRVDAKTRAKTSINELLRD